MDHPVPRVSVLIPVYNAERHIERCVRSLFDQTMAEGVEIIFVDDCTPDSSIEVLERVLMEYPGRKEQVKIIRHQSNLRQFAARATAFAQARGEYVLIVDNDDYFEPDMLEAMYTRAKTDDADIVFADFYKTYHDRETYVEAGNRGGDLLDLDDLILGHTHSYLWNKMFRRSLYTENSAEVTTVGEDVEHCIQLFFLARKFSHIPKAYTHYVCYNAQATTTIMNDWYKEKIIHMVGFLEDFLTRQGVYERYRASMLQRMLKTRVILLLKTPASERRKWVGTFARQTDSIILKKGILNLPSRIALWCAVHGMMPVFNIAARIYDKA